MATFYVTYMYIASTISINNRQTQTKYLCVFFHACRFVDTIVPNITCNLAIIMFFELAKISQKNYVFNV